ncbi:glycoside hydrolase family 38 C-terminal domain-containing protein [Arthrobacter sp. H5]|uniref:glycoside hydrolase family 38 N-terminal domain-containing protein n=1 Tax=Arthrobacter sp. H5 TaxID=1267973 RepID=UPI0004875E9A|nr:glycoside hydrolase family 38 C-terminal domain-containing protein [Arthrobacter sp. H5]
MSELLKTCHVISHVHWDREWYRGFDGYRGRLVDLVERVCGSLEQGHYASFHLDGQTVILADVLEVRPDLEARISGHINSGRLTVGPWHVLADNQLVSVENLVRNLLRARRWGNRMGRLSTVGYSPDAFGHPADLPRLLNGFGMDTALVWRGAPPEHARFRWISPDGSEVFTVNQGYHQTETLWDSVTSGVQLKQFVQAERQRLPDGPLLLLNGGDHVVPRPPAERTAAAADAGVGLVETTLGEFFTVAREADGELPVVRGELRTLGNRLTFLLPGTLSARTYVKLANSRAQTLLERYAEPQLVRHLMRPATSPASHAELLDHAWDLVIKNAPHDSICGCSTDEVHRQTTVRAERAIETGELLVRRLLLAEGVDTRQHGDPARDQVDVVVLSGQGTTVSGHATLDAVTEPGRVVTRVKDHGGRDVPFELESTRREKVFEADLDLLPDTRETDIHTIAFAADAVPAFGWKAFRVELSDGPASPPQRTPSRRIDTGRFVIEVLDNASLRVHDTETGRMHDGVGRLASDGDRGDTYNFDPIPGGVAIEPRVTQVEASSTALRTRINIEATITLPEGIQDNRNSRSDTTVDSPLSITVTQWAGTDRLEWSISLDNRARDHRLRFEVPIDVQAVSWTADQHWSTIERPVGPELGVLPTEAAFEAEHPVAPVSSWACAGTGPSAVALLTRGLPEVQAIRRPDSAVLSVTVLRAVGWLSRFDLRTRTTGAGPMMAVPEAQCIGPIGVNVAAVFGESVRPDSMDFVASAALHQSPLRTFALRPGCPPPAGQTARQSAPEVVGALVSAWKPVEENPSRGGSVLRISNPTARAVSAVVRLPEQTTSVDSARIDETIMKPLTIGQERRVHIDLPPYGLETLILR